MKWRKHSKKMVVLDVSLLQYLSYYVFSLQYGGLVKLPILYLRHIYLELANFELYTSYNVVLT